MAKKSTAKKSARKSTAKKAADAKSASQKPRRSTKSKAAGSKAEGAKKTVKKAAGKSAAKKSAAKKAGAAKASSKKPAGAGKQAARKTSAKKTARKSTASKKPKSAEPRAESAGPVTGGQGADKAAKKPARKADAKEASTKQTPPDKARADDKADAGDKKAGRKGITIVEPAKKSSSKGKAQSKYNPPVRPMLLGPGSTFTKPLIPSGPSAPKVTSVLDGPKSRRTKSPFSKSKLEKFRSLLIAKRAELLGDVESMENEALRSGSGGLSNTPQHLAEQGSESYDQSLSLNLAAQDRRLIKEIDEALRRIEDGTYGLCELTNQPISEERLEELPWARYTIEAARQLETRGSRP